MTVIRMIQLECEFCAVIYPSTPAVNTSAKDLRAEAAKVGWEVLRHTTGRDLCPQCRIKEIQLAAKGEPDPQ